MSSGGNNKLSFEQVVEKLMFRTDVVLCEDGFNGWSKKSKFYDLVVQDYFYTVPKRLYIKHLMHPKRNYQRRIKTIEERYGKGITNMSQLNFVKEKKKNKNIEKYGIECNLHVPEVREKIKKGWKKKYKTEFPQQNNIVKEKLKQTVLKKYGAENYFSSKEFEELYSNSERYIIETGEHLIDYHHKLPEPKPNYEKIRRLFDNKPINLKDVENLYKNYHLRPEKSTLEMFVEKEYGYLFHNRKVLGSKPDFKLSDNVYLNVDGIYWHSTHVLKNNHYHFNLRKKFEENNIKIFQFREHELFLKKNIILSTINRYFKKTNNCLNVNKCYYENVTQRVANKFLNENDLKGSIKKAKHIALKNNVNNNVVGLVSYITKDNKCFVKRLSFKNDYFIKDGNINLLIYLEKFLLKNNLSKNIEYVFDLRYDCEDEFIKNIDYKHVEDKLCYDVIPKVVFTKNTNIKLDNAKLCTLYDAGQRLYVKNINKN